MALIIRKHFLPENKSDSILRMTLNSEILSIQVKGRLITIWTLEDEKDDKYLDRRFITRMTGHAVPANAFWWATVLKNDLAYHIFEVYDDDD